MVRDERPIKVIKGRLIRFKELFENKFKHDAPSVVSDIADSLIKP